MTREGLKELIDIMRPSRITADMIADPLVRSMRRIRERAWNRMRDDLLALYADRTLTDAQREDGFRKADLRKSTAMKKLIPLEERYEMEVTIPSMLRSGYLRRAPKPAKRRSK